jgi:hypothetical protein
VTLIAGLSRDSVFASRTWVRCSAQSLFRRSPRLTASYTVARLRMCGPLWCSNDHSVSSRKTAPMIRARLPLYSGLAAIVLERWGRT